MPMNRRRQIRFRPVGFATDSPLEGNGFEPSVPRKIPAPPWYRLSFVRSLHGRVEASHMTSCQTYAHPVLMVRIHFPSTRESTNASAWSLCTSRR
jgi:hypothetical protein